MAPSLSLLSDSALDLPAALARWAAERPEAPWLFHPEGLDWRWLSFADAAAEVERLAALAASALAAAGHAPPVAVSFPYAPRPASVLLDLALQRAGYTAAPQPPGEPLRHLEVPAEAWAEQGADGEADGVRPNGLDMGRDAALDAGLDALPGGGGDGGSDALPVAAGFVGGVEVRAAGGTIRTLTAAELAGWAAGLEEAIAAAGPLRRPEREVVISGTDLSDPLERRILAWSLQQGAVLLLEPIPASRVGTAGWARPTVFHGSPQEMEALVREAAHHDREGFAGLKRRLGHPPASDLPFRRLHTLLIGPFPGEDVWQQRGVRRVDPEV